MASTKKISYKDLKNKNQNSNQLVESFAALNNTSSQKVNFGFTEVEIDSITEDPKGDFVELFAFDHEAAKIIADSIIKSDYDKTQLIHLARIIEEPETMDSPLRIDGKHRIEASKIAGLTTIPAYIHTFETRKQALIYAYELQLHRRNLEPYQKLDALEKLDALKNPGRKSSDNEEAPGKSAEEMGKLIGVSTRTAERMRNINNNADEEIKEAVKKNEISITKADELTNIKKNKPRKNRKEEDEINERENSNEGSPAPLNFNHSDGIERPVPETGDDTVFVTLEEKNIQVEGAKKQGFADGFWKALVFALSEIQNGKTPEEVYKDERISDMSPDVIFNFELPENAEDTVLKF